jgi:hypothetical protein
LAVTKNNEARFFVALRFKLDAWYTNGLDFLYRLQASLTDSLHFSILALRQPLRQSLHHVDKPDFFDLSKEKQLNGFVVEQPLHRFVPFCAIFITPQRYHHGFAILCVWQHLFHQLTRLFTGLNQAKEESLRI